MNKKNIFAILVPIIICIIIFLLPESIQGIFVLDINNLNLWNWFTYIFVHEGFAHLKSNMIFYLITSFLVYFILPKQDKEKFYILIILSLFIVPLFTLILTLFLRNVGLFPTQLIYNRGFSGIDSAILGMLGVALARNLSYFFSERPSNKLIIHLCYFFIIPSLTIMVLDLSWKLSLILFAIWIFLIPLIIHILKKDCVLKYKKTQNLFYDFPFILGCCLLILESAMLIPKNIVQNGVIVNIFAHFIGFVIGGLLIFFITIKK
jgi:membrane associated rhomboid family serine protease